MVSTQYILSHRGGGGDGKSSSSSSNRSSSSNSSSVVPFLDYDNNFLFISLEPNFQYILHTATIALCLKILLASY